MSGLEIIVVIAVIGFVVFQQVAGQKVAGKRLIVLPAVLTVVGFLDLHGAKGLHHADYVWLVIGAAGSLAIGLAFGAITRIGSRDGVLWAKLPVWGLLLWVAMFAFRGLVMVLAAHTGAHVAASATPLLFTLGLNRLGQAAVIAVRAMAAGIPFAPEKDGSTFLGGSIGNILHDR
ncbi:MAG TPA: hypothetical protein VGG16_11690 [Streptosporangiaceae bacterium]|jgi:hypothetical protein